MDIPDKIFHQSEVRLWRVNTVVHILDASEADRDYHIQNPLPVYSSKHLVGFGSLDIRGRYVYASLAMDYSIPERLDLEAGLRYWVVPHIYEGHVRIGRFSYWMKIIDRLDLSSKPYQDLSHIGAGAI